MWGHVSEAGLLDLLDGAASADARGHVEGCGRCRDRLQAAREGLRAAIQADVPEPSPFYWPAFQRQVAERLAGGSPRLRFGLWPVLAGLALLIGWITVVPPRPVSPALGQATLPVWSALPPIAEDSAFSLLRGLEPAEDDLILVSAPHGVASLIVGLSDAESQELQRVLAGELGSGRS